MTCQRRGHLGLIECESKVLYSLTQSWKLSLRHRVYHGVQRLDPVTEDIGSTRVSLGFVPWVTSGCGRLRAGCDGHGGVRKGIQTGAAGAAQHQPR